MWFIFCLVNDSKQLSNHYYEKKNLQFFPIPLKVFLFLVIMTRKENEIFYQMVTKRIEYNLFKKYKISYDFEDK